MKKILFLSITLFLFQSICIAKEITLSCSCIAQFTDMYVKFEPMTLTEKGIIKLNNKKVGSYVMGKENAIFGLLGKNSFSYDLEKGLLIYSVDIGDKIIPAYGACQLVK